MEFPGFVGPSNKARGVIADCSRLLNFYIERQSTTARPGIYAFPGQTRFTTTPDTGGRALFQMNERTLAVMGSGVYGLAADGTPTKYGTVKQDEFLAFISMNGTAGAQALVGSGGNAYVLNLATNVLSAAVLTGEAQQIGFLDGYGIAFNRTLGRIRISDLNDFNTWDPTQFQGRNDAADNWLAMLVNAPDIWLVGGQTGCVWFDQGSFPFPLAPRPGVNFPYGIVAPDSIATAGDSVLWLSSNDQGAGVVVRAQGYVPQRFSSYAMEAAVARYLRESRIDDAEGWGLTWEGHTFYILRFPAAGGTWFVDMATGDWQELSSFDSAAGMDRVWRPRVHALAFGKHLVADSSTGIIAYLDVNSGTEVDGTAQRLVRIPPSLLARDGERIQPNTFRLQMVRGVGSQAGQGADPVVMMRQSKDFGETWGSERRAAIGKIGKRETEILFTRCDSSETGWVPEIVITDPARPIAIVGADLTGDNLGIQRGQA